MAGLVDALAFGQLGSVSNHCVCVWLLCLSLPAAFAMRAVPARI
jgi:hypothetical protein